MNYTFLIVGRVAELCHFAPAPEPCIFFTAVEQEPAPTEIILHQFFMLMLTLPCIFFFKKTLHVWVSGVPSDKK